MTALEWAVLLLAAVPVVWLWVYAIGDLIRRRDISGLHRGVWIGGIVVVPLVGALLYLIYRPARGEDLRGFGRRRRTRRDDGPSPR